MYIKGYSNWLLNDSKAFNFSNILYNLNKDGIVIEILFDHSYAIVR